MVDDTVAKMIAAMTAGEGVVEIDVFEHVVAHTLQALVEMDNNRTERLRGGDRVAYLYRHAVVEKYKALNYRPFSLAMMVDADEVELLIKAGATWVGGPEWEPAFMKATKAV
jgi:hypothetical protein